LVIALAGCAGVVLAGAGGALAGVLAAVTVSKRWRARREQTRSITAAADVVQALGLLVGELRAGAHPAVAAEHTAADAGPAASAVLRTIARTARLSGDVAAALRRQADADIGLEQPLRQLAAAWTLGSRHGIPLADVLEAVRRDLDHQVRARRRLHSALAGPRATATVLATLPILGLLLGQAVGAQPWHVLTGHPAGQVLLVLGSALICAGFSWSARLAGRAGAS
jgi:tight adherence protein B